MFYMIWEVSQMRLGGHSNHYMSFLLNNTPIFFLVKKKKHFFDVQTSKRENDSNCYIFQSIFFYLELQS